MPWLISVPVPQAADPPLVGPSLPVVAPVSSAQPAPLSQAGSSPQTQTQTTAGITVEWRVQRYLPQSGRALFTGGVTARYGPTVLKAEELELDYAAKRGWARGKVEVLDPEGSLSARELEFDWAAGTGTALDVEAYAEPVRFRAKRLRIEPGVWTLEDVFATPSRTRPPEIAVRAPRLTLRPGRSGRLVRPSFDLFGWGTGPYPSYSFSLDPRVEGFRLPAVTFKRGAGLGFAWQSGFMVGKNLSLFANTNVMQTEYPRSRIALAWSAVKPNRNTGWLLPQSELGERFGKGFLDNVYVRTPETEDRWLGAQRRTIAVVSSTNESVAGRLVSPDGITKPWDLAAEISQRVNPRLALYGQARVQSVRLAQRDPFQTRSLVQSSALYGPVPVGPQLQLRFRLDTFATVGAGTDGYGWTRGAATLAWRPTPRWTFGLGASVAGASGKPGLVIDPLAYGNLVMGRATYDYGPYRGSVLLKYDYRQGRWVDTEYAASLVAGSFEPYVEARLFPREYRLGVRLRLDSFFARLRDPEATERPPLPTALP